MIDCNLFDSMCLMLICSTLFILVSSGSRFLWWREFIMLAFFRAKWFFEVSILSINFIVWFLWWWRDDFLCQIFFILLIFLRLYFFLSVCSLSILACFYGWVGVRVLGLANFGLFIFLFHFFFSMFSEEFLWSFDRSLWLWILCPFLCFILW